MPQTRPAAAAYSQLPAELDQSIEVVEASSRGFAGKQCAPSKSDAKPFGAAEVTPAALRVRAARTAAAKQRAQATTASPVSPPKRLWSRTSDRVSDREQGQLDSDSRVPEKSLRQTTVDVDATLKTRPVREHIARAREILDQRSAATGRSGGLQVKWGKPISPFTEVTDDDVGRGIGAPMYSARAALLSSQSYDSGPDSSIETRDSDAQSLTSQEETTTIDPADHRQHAKDWQEALGFSNRITGDIIETRDNRRVEPFEPGSSLASGQPATKPKPRHSANNIETKRQGYTANANHATNLMALYNNVQSWKSVAAAGVVLGSIGTLLGFVALLVACSR